jgi:hypothetical protein
MSKFFFLKVNCSISRYNDHMKLVERHIITKNHSCWSEIDHLAFLSKNLFNLANYHYRQHFFEQSTPLNFNQLYHTVSSATRF